MPTILVKNRNKPKKAQIIPAEKVIYSDKMAKIPIFETDDAGLIDITNSNFSEIILKDIEDINITEKQIEAKINLRNKKKDLPKFTEHFTITNVDTPIDISTQKIPEQSIPISEVKEELQQAYDKGFDDGQQVTISTFKYELETHQKWVKTFDTIVSNLHKHYQNVLKKTELSVANLATLIASEIIGNELSEKKDKILSLIKSSIQNIDIEDIIKIRLNPKDIEILKEVDSQLYQKIQKDEGSIIPDYSVDSGGCILETNIGIIDAKIKSQLKKINEKIEDAIKNEYQEEDLTEIFYPDKKNDLEEKNND